MSKSNEISETAGEDVVRAAGELNATVKAAAEAAEQSGVDQEEAKNWLTTIFKALLAAFGK